jgi:hypothetical protein
VDEDGGSLFFGAVLSSRSAIEMGLTGTGDGAVEEAEGSHN